MFLLGVRESRGRSGRRGVVVCTLVRDEESSVREWLMFHSLLGVSTFVVYDDNSSDGTVSVVQSVGREVSTEVVVERFPPTSCPSWPATSRALCQQCASGSGREGPHTQATCQRAAFQHCAATYGPRAEWLAVFDVDEFVFPCSDRDWSLPDVFRRATTDYLGAAWQLKMECLKFGTSSHTEPISHQQTLIETHQHRAPYSALREPELELKSQYADCSRKVWNTELCETAGGNKFVARGEHVVLGSVHDGMISSWVAHLKQTSSHGLCCNHYGYKSWEEMLMKAEKNHNEHLKSQANSTDVIRFFNAVRDTRILRYARQLRDMLYKKSS